MLSGCDTDRHRSGVLHEFGGSGGGNQFTGQVPGCMHVLGRGQCRRAYFRETKTGWRYGQNGGTDGVNGDVRDGRGTNVPDWHSGHDRLQRGQIEKKHSHSSNPYH